MKVVNKSSSKKELEIKKELITVMDDQKIFYLP